MYKEQLARYLNFFNRCSVLERSEEFARERTLRLITKDLLLREILAKSVQIDAVVTFPDVFDFTKLLTKIFPWLGRYNIFEYKGKSDLLKVGQYVQYALVELGLMLTRVLSKERKDKAGREWRSQKSIREYWNKLKSQGAKHLCTTTILSTGDPRGIRKKFGLEPVTEYPHLRGVLYRQVIFKNELLGTVAVYLVVLNKLKVCAINAPLLLLSSGKKLSEFCQWLLTDAEGLTVDEQVAYQTLITTYNIVDDEEVKSQESRSFWVAWKQSNTFFYVCFFILEF